ncbi:MAG TPA: glycosyltransferase, partial [Bacteroidia bacterium]|nr:glycosyltransferase [Bacteroidia bacterium]
TIVIPVYNQERFVAKAIESALNQIYDRCSVLIVNDGSTDGTERIIKQYCQHAKIISQANSGTSCAWNKAIDIAKTDYLIGLDSDDEFVPETVSEMLKILKENPSSDLIYSDYEFIDISGTIKEVVRNPEPINPITQLMSLHDNLGQPNNFLPFGHVRLYRREMLLKIGGFNESFFYAEDFELVLRIAEAGLTFKHIPQVLYKYRWHNTNKGVLKRKEQKDEVKRAVKEFRIRNI